MYGKTLADYPGRFELFCDALTGLADANIDFGFKEALKYLTEFPVPAQVRQYAESMTAPVESHESYNRMVEAYKARHRAGTAADPTPVNTKPFDESLAAVSTAKAMDAPGKTLHEQQRAAALARLGGSTMPTDPTKLPGWHEEAAIKNGWKEARRPGGDEV